MRVVVAGGTGWVGRLVVAQARARGLDAVALSRATGADLTTGAGVDDALVGADVVVDTTNAPGSRRSVSVQFFRTATRTLLAAGQRAGVTHHVVLSIVGIEKVPLGYYAGKLEQEALVAEGPVPWTVLRTTQFHEFAAQLVSYGRGPVLAVPPMRSAPVAAREVAGHLVDLAVAAPAGRAPALRGPEVHHMPELVRRLLAAQHSRRVVLALPQWGALARAMSDGSLLPGEGAVVGHQDFASWLTEYTARGGGP